jgi:hypothetical protein
MWLSSWLRRRHPSRSAGLRPGFRPTLEGLEGRWLPSTLTVTSNLDNGPGSLRADVAAAQGGDTIVFSNSLKGQTIALTTGELLLDKSLTIQGPCAGQLAISGSNVSRVFEVAAGVQVTLAGLTVRDGDGNAAVVARTGSDGEGGAILNGGTLTVSSCTIFGNSASDSGGGLYNSGTLTVSSCTVSGNTAYRGGGIYNGGSASLGGSTLSGNTATGGYLSGFGWVDPVELDWMEGGGGGLWNAGTMTVSDTTLSGNHAGGPVGGGGLYNSGTLTVSTGTVSGNSADALGGGIYNDEGATPTLKQSTVTQNTAPELYNLGYLTSKGSKIG